MSIESTSKNNVSAVDTEKVSKSAKNIYYKVYQLMNFRCMMSLSYKCTFLCNVLVKSIIQSESLIRFLFL